MDKADIYEKLSLCTSEELPVRVATYHTLTEIFSSLTQASDWGTKITEDIGHSIISNIKQDLFNEKYDVCYEATGFLGCFLANEKLMDLFTVDEEQEIIDSLIKLLKETKEKTVLTRGLWSLAQSKFECETYSKNLPSLLNLFTDILKCDPTNIMIYEALQVVKSLMESVPDNMIDKINIWLPKIFEYLFHDALKVRGIAYSCLNFCQIYTQERKCLNILNQHVVPFIPKLKSQYCKEMINLLDGNCSFILKIWRLLVIILGQNLHSGTTLINGFLEVVEKAFKCSKPEFRIDAFKCWHVLIGNFSTNIEVLAHPKRLKLLIAPFKSNNAKTEDIALMKLHTWWFFVCKLDDHISTYFDLIVVPLLKFCFDFNRVAQHFTNERKFLMSSSSASCTKYPSLILKTIEVLSAILNHEQSLLNNFNISLNHPILNNVLFMKNYHLIFGCVADSLVCLDSTNSYHLKIGCDILKSLLKYVNAILKEYFNKKESFDMVKEFLNIFDQIENECKPGDSITLFYFEFLKLSFLGSQALSCKVLQSRFYHIPVRSKIRDIMNGCLANYFIHKLCKPVLSYYASSDPGYLEIWHTALQKGKAYHKLEFFESVIEELENALSYPGLQAPEVLVSLWSSTSKALDSHIEETRQINQGDCSDHDWTCIYSTLMFPLHSSKYLHCINDTSYTNLIANWAKLWNSFTSLTALTATAEPNSEAEFLTKKMHSLIQSFTPSSEAYGFTLALFAEILFHIMEKFRFKELWNKSKSAFQSPLVLKKKLNPLSNLGSIIELLKKLMSLAIDMVSYWRNKTMQKLCACLIKIFSSILQENLAWIVVCNINDVMKLALQINPRAKFNVDTEKTFVAMWNSFCGLIECRIVPNLVQDKLEFLSPLICIALQSSHLSLRQRTRLMWSTSFTSTSLIIPKSLLSTLETVGLPPASDGDSTSLDSQAMPLQENKDEILPFDFKHFNQECLNVSPRIDLKLELSPLSSIKKRELRGTKNQKQVKIFGIDEIKSNDFVVVSSPNVNKRIFTKKQMEKMKERSADIPALYNDMSQSMSQSDFETINQNGMKMRNESYFSNKNIRIDSNGLQGLNDSFASEMKSYSDEELNEVLRDASHEFEKSLSDSVIILETSKEIEDFKNIQSSCCHKRKSQTPSKKTISDIKKKLKGTLRNSKSSVENKNSAIHGSILKQSNEDLSPLASPLNSPVRNINKNKNIDCNNENLLIQTSHKLSPKLYDHNFQEKNDKRYLEVIECSPKNMNETFAASDDEIPDSQVELLESNHRFSLSGNRPRRNKRKSIFENSSMYVTPHKRSKLSQSPQKSDKFLEDYSRGQNDFCFLKNENNSNKIVGTKPFSRDNSSESDKSRSETSMSPSTPCKITRSGRRVIAPNKDMPEPMTPPGLKLKKNLLKENEFEDKTLLSSEILSTKIFESKLRLDKDYVLKDKKSESEMAEIHHQSSYKESETTNFTPSASDTESRAFCSYEEKAVCFNKQNHGKNIDSINEESCFKKSKIERSIACKIKFPDKVDKNDAIDKSQVHCDINIAYRSPQEQFRIVPLEEAPVCEEATMSNKDEDINSNTLNINSSDVQSMMINNLDSCSLISSSDTIKSVKDEVNNQRTLVSAMSSYSSSLKSNENVSKPHSNIDNSSNLNEKDIKIVSKNFCKLSVIKNKDACKVSEFSKEIHVANGGIVFINSNDLQKQVSKQRTGYLLRKCRSLEKFSPTKTNSDIFQKNSVKSLTYENKRILIISSPKTSSSPVKKDVYSPQTYEDYLKIKSNSSEIYIKSRGNAENENLMYNNNDHENSTSIIESVYMKENSSKLLNDLSPHFSESEGNKISNSNEPGEEKSFEIDEHLLDKETQDLNEKNRPKTVTKKRKGVLKRKSKSGKMHHNKTSFSNPVENEIQNNLDTTSVRKGMEKFINDTNDFKCASDKESPDKGNSKLSNSISTPERKKCSAKKMQITGTRAAVMLACAKKHLKTRDENFDSMPEGHTSEMGFDDRNLQNEDDDIVNQISSNITPIRKCSISIVNDPVWDERPWAKHEPSPRSSPCGSILKKKRLRDFCKRSSIGDIVTESEDSPLMWKSRRVSFADPPVSERVEIPPSPQILKSHKAQKRLDMSQALDSTNQHFEIFPSSEEIEMSDVLQTNSSYNAPLYSSLLGCSEHVDIILPMLTTPSLIESLKIVFKDRGIRTVGDLSSISEMELQSLPVRSPKSSNTIKCLKEFESQHNSNREEKSLITNSIPGLVKETNIAISNASSAAEQEKETENSSLCFSNDLNCSLTFESDDVRRNASFVKDALEKQEYFSSQQTQEINAKSIQDDEIIKKFCNQVTEDENLVTSFIQGLSEETRLNIFKGLTKVIPYKDLIDIFYQYLKQQK